MDEFIPPLSFCLHHFTVANVTIRQPSHILPAGQSGGQLSRRIYMTVPGFKSQLLLKDMPALLWFIFFAG